MRTRPLPSRRTPCAPPASKPRSLAIKARPGRHAASGVLVEKSPQQRSDLGQAALLTADREHLHAINAGRDLAAERRARSPAPALPGARPRRSRRAGSPASHRRSSAAYLMPKSALFRRVFAKARQPVPRSPRDRPSPGSAAMRERAQCRSDRRSPSCSAMAPHLVEGRATRPGIAVRTKGDRPRRVLRNRAHRKSAADRRAGAPDP